MALSVSGLVSFHTVTAAVPAGGARRVGAGAGPRCQETAKRCSFRAAADALSSRAVLGVARKTKAVDALPFEAFIAMPRRIEGRAGSISQHLRP